MPSTRIAIRAGSSPACWPNALTRRKYAPSAGNVAVALISPVPPRTRPTSLWRMPPAAFPRSSASQAWTGPFQGSSVTIAS
ncbi:MAG: hypothetical protein WKF75_09370, partial [Singulisphaera sp.]